MLRSRFHRLPTAFQEKLVRSSGDRPHRKGLSSLNTVEEPKEDKEVFAKFSQLWNEIIECLREEDYLSNYEKELLLIPQSRDSSTYNQWPAFLLADKVSFQICIS
jgi:callose synthase